MTDTAVDPAPRLKAAGAPPAELIAELVGRIHAIGPLLRENALLADKTRVLPQATVDALEETGALRIAALRRYGGYEGGASMLLEVARTVGYYDPAAAWCTVISNGSVMLANRYEDDLLDQIFAAGPVRMASIFASPQGTAVPENGGWRVSGQWPFASNSSHSEWAIGILFLKENVDGPEDAAPRIGFAMMKRGEYEVRDTWYTIGMRGSGSNTMVAEDLWLPQNRIITFERLMGDGFEKDPEATFGRRLTPHLTMSTTIQASSLGAAAAALDYVTEKAQTRPITYTHYKRQIDSGAFVQNLGQASMKIDSAKLLLQRSAAMIDAAAAGTEPMPLADRARNRGGIGHAGHELVDAVNELCWLHGTAAFAENSLLGRMWRDVNTGTRHASITAPMGYELHGDGLTGVDYISTKL
ncbi:hypothetical protein LVY72_23240 [Arthrobacter sp. I2-34]|uniref:Acyl-CoA dehydrogenase C-terminal domain-containing protein n=1 Tax=Arthrobacter hankyongi TaxID=2904801 RepID=A0ABS9LDV5_9MICC|nr:hypothetical protein [Arthrobacter hankyongi]MCG2624808.1 hypothetical protein [Arthrobacter hankyongi]